MQQVFREVAEREETIEQMKVELRSRVDGPPNNCFYEDKKFKQNIFEMPRDSAGYQSTTQAYFKYLEADKKVSKRDRIAKNLDKDIKQVRNNYVSNVGGNAYARKGDTSTFSRDVLGPPRRLDLTQA